MSTKNEYGNIWLPVLSEYSIDNFVLGIDFGTSNSCISLWNPQKNRAKVIKSLNKKITPSTVLFKNIKDFSVGHPLDQSYLLESIKGGIDDQVLITYIKTFLGKNTADDTHNTFIDDEGKLKVYCSKSRDKSESLHPETIASYIFKFLKNSAEIYLRERHRKFITKDSPLWNDSKSVQCLQITRAVIGLPANFNDIQRSAIRHSAELAGFTDIHFIVESTAAAIAYGLLNTGRKNVLVVDIGGGTTDLTVLHIDEGCNRVDAVGGCGSCGGVHIDRLMSAYIMDILSQLGLCLKGNSRISDAVLASCIHCKELLSTEDKAVVSILKVLLTAEEIDILKSINHLEICHTCVLTKTSFDIEISREVFEDMISPITSVIHATTRDVLNQWLLEQDSNSGNEDSDTLATSAIIRKKDIDEVVLVGGSSRIPALRSAVRSAMRDVMSKDKEEVGKEVEFCSSISPDEAVAQGLAVRGAIIAGQNMGRLKDVLMMDMLPNAIGVMAWKKRNEGQEQGEESREFNAVLYKGDRIPASDKRRFQVFDVKQKFVSVDIYEEVEEYNVCVKEKEGKEKEEGLELVTRHALIGTYDFKIPRSVVLMEGSAAAAAASMFITVRMTMNAEGELHFEVEDPAAAAGIHVHEEDVKREEVNTATMYFLSFIIAVLAIAYLFVKTELK